MAGVIMSVDAQIAAGHHLHHCIDDLRDFVWKCATVGIAQNHPARASFKSGLCAGQSVVRVCLVAIKEVLAVDHGFFACLDGGFDRVCDAFQIFLVGALQRNINVVVPAFCHIACGVCCRLEDHLNTGIIADRAPSAFGHAKGGEGRFLCSFFGEELCICWVCARVAAFNIVDAQSLQ